MKQYAAATPLQAKRVRLDGTVDLEIKLPSKMKERVRKYAKQNRTSMSQVVADAIAARLS